MYAHASCTRNLQASCADKLVGIQGIPAHLEHMAQAAPAAQPPAAAQAQQAPAAPAPPAAPQQPAQQQPAQPQNLFQLAQQQQQLAQAQMGMHGGGLRMLGEDLLQDTIGIGQQMALAGRVEESPTPWNPRG